jgi:hypothetical protein
MNVVLYTYVMRFKSFFAYTLLSLCFIALVAPAFAADFQLSHIGSLATAGSRYSHWWYTGTNPMLKGTGTADSGVEITFGDMTYSTTVDASGNWSYAVPAEQGDYAVSLMHAGASYDFTLHLGQELPENVGEFVSETPEATQSTGAVPETGFDQFIGVTLGLGVLLLGSYFYFWGNGKKNFSLERRFIRE